MIPAMYITVLFPCLYHIRKSRLDISGIEWFYWFVTLPSLLSWSGMLSRIGRGRVINWTLFMSQQCMLNLYSHYRALVLIQTKFACKDITIQTFCSIDLQVSSKLIREKICFSEWHIIVLNSTIYRCSNHHFKLSSPICSHGSATSCETRHAASWVDMVTHRWQHRICKLKSLLRTY